MELVIGRQGSAAVATSFEWNLSGQVFSIMGLKYSWTERKHFPQVPINFRVQDCDIDPEIWGVSR